MRNIVKRLPATCLVVGCMILLTNCGYRFSSSGQFPAGVKKIFITIFDNGTSQVGVENVLADAVTTELTTRANAAAVAGSRASADAVLTGTITAVQTDPISRGAETITDEARLIIRVDARLTSSGGIEIWNARQVSATDTYNVVQDDKRITEINKNAALERAAVRLAEQLYSRLVEDF